MSNKDDTVKMDSKKFQKIVFIHNAIEKGWSVKKQGEAYIFSKKYLGKKEVFDKDYLDKFIEEHRELPT